MEKEEINKTFLAPDYDDEDIDDDFDEDIDEDGEEEAIENFLDKQENIKNNNSNSNMTTPTSSVFGSNSAPSWGQPSTPSWGSSNNNNNSIWGSNNQQNNSGSIWGSNNNSSPWNNRPSSGWGTGNGSWGGSIGEKKEIDRKKRVIICDVLDCLVETYQSNGKPGLLPRGIYDMRLRFDVWDKIACFNPEKVFAMVPKALLNSSNGSDSWKVMLDYIVCSFSEYLRSPYQVCQILLQTRIGQPKEELIQQVLMSNVVKEDIIQIGVNSGLYGQNNKDQIAAMRCNIDYIDLGTFMNSYF